MALRILLEHEDEHSAGIALSSLARLWQASGDAALPGQVAEILGTTPEEAEARLRKLLAD